MLNQKYKNKTCKVCDKSFMPTRGLQRVCGPVCAIRLIEHQKSEKARKANSKALRARKEALRSKSDWAKLAQKEFNAFIRLRDQNDPCISCGRYHQGQYHAGHYRTTAAQPALRFNEIGCHLQCMPCNTHKSGNISEYRINLIKKIGIELVEWLEIDHPQVKPWTVEELQAVRRYYRDAQKAMKQTVGAYEPF